MFSLLLSTMFAMAIATDVTAPGPAAPVVPAPAESTVHMIIFVCSAVGILFSIFQCKFFNFSQFCFLLRTLSNIKYIVGDMNGLNDCFFF